MSDYKTFQQRVWAWMGQAFKGQGGKDLYTRCCRFYEEATELVQANQLSREDAHKLVDYVYDRPVGQPHQELGGTMITLAALAAQQGNDMMEEGERELARVWQPEIMQKIRDKQKHKPSGPLPQDAVPYTFTDADVGKDVVFTKPVTQRLLLGTHTYAVAGDRGRILAVRPGEIVVRLEYETIGAQRDQVRLA